MTKKSKITSYQLIYNMFHIILTIIDRCLFAFNCIVLKGYLIEPSNLKKYFVLYARLLSHQ